jgi:uncharacterized protein (DUF2252 family)
MRFRDVLFMFALGPLGCVASPPSAPAPSRDVVALVVAHDRELAPADRDARWERLAGSPHAFFRGTPYLFWADVGEDPRLARFGGDDARTWVVGDAHAENFGCLESARHEVVYDLNDFDEAVIADAQLDLWRLATSLLLVLREQDDLDADEQREALSVLANAYLAALELFVDGEAEREHRLTANDAFGLLDDLLVDTEAGESRGDLLAKWTTSEDGAPALDLDRDDLEEAPAALVTALERAWPAYLESLAPGRDWPSGYFRVKSVARRLDAGTASLGVARYYVLVEGPSVSADDDRILDVKQQGAPAGPAPAGLSPEERCARGERALAPAGDPHSGWLRLETGEGFTVHERSPFRARLALKKLTTLKRAREVAEQWGWLLAAAHARGDRDGDPERVSTSLEDALLARVAQDRAAFASLVVTVAEERAEQTTRDHAAFAAWRARQGS